MVEPQGGQASMDMGKVYQAFNRMVSISDTQYLSQFNFSETDLGGTGCGKAVRPGLWGSGEATSRSTRTP